jgi:methionyl-tRNA formyltransferase
VKIAVLATYDGILGGRFVRALLAAGVTIDSILLDSKATDPRDLRIHEERTRGRLPPVSLHEFAAARIPLFALGSHNDVASAQLVAERSIDVLVNAGTPRILKAAMLSAASLGVLNCHPGLLPYYRGSSCVEWALLRGDAVGNTVHLMTKGIDEGDVLMAEAVAVPAGASYSAVRTTVYEAGFALMAKACRGLADGRHSRADFRPQQGGAYHKPIDAVSMVRLMQFYPEAAS